jgi:hypothetical protein
LEKTWEFFSAMHGAASSAEMITILQRDFPDDGIDPDDLYIPSREEVDALGPDSILSRPQDGVWIFHQIYGLLNLKVGDREIGLRKELKGAIEHIRDCADSFMPSDLPGDMTQHEKTCFCRFLLNFGAVRLGASKGAQ